MIELSPTQLKQILPRCKTPDMWCDELNAVMPYYGIVTHVRIAMFIAQCGHESAEFNVLEENLNYSAQALRRVFGKYFPSDELAQQYARNPMRIASRVYANRMGNGDESSGDGWRYRGRGLIQITGKNNYRACSRALFDGDERVLLDDPDLLLMPTYAVQSAGWFWEVNRLNQYGADVVRVTRIINGGTNGLEHRRELFERAMRVLHGRNT